MPKEVNGALILWKDKLTPPPVAVESVDAEPVELPPAGDPHVELPPAGDPHAGDPHAGDPHVIKNNHLKEEPEEKEEPEREGADAPTPPRTEIPGPVQVFKTITGKNSIRPELYELICDTLTSSPDEKRLRDVWVAWVAHDYRRTNIAGVLDWYKNGIPGNGNGGARRPPQKTAQEIALEHLRKLEEVQGGN